MAPSTYIHGTDPAEQDRLSRLNDLLNDAALEQIAVAPGERVLDVGCGLAQLTRAMARASGRRAVGVEKSRPQLARALRIAADAGETELVDLREGDAAALPLASDERGSFDLAHARFVLEHVADPAAVVREMQSAVRPGGRIVLEDDDHERMCLWPEPPGFSAVWRAYMRLYDRHGNDAIVGRRLTQILAAAGARPVRNTLLFFGSCAGRDDFSLYVENLAGILLQARDEMAAAGFFEATATVRAVEELRAWAGNPGGAIWYGVAWAEAVVDLSR